jgi:uncharacterized protein YcfJ
MLRRSLAATVALGLVGSTNAFAHHDHGVARRDGTVEYVEARVVAVRPIVRQVVVERPRRECWNEVVDVPESGLPYGVAGPTIAGGIVGAAIGRQFGSGSGRDALTMLGALAGSAVAHDRALRRQGYADEPATREETVRRCRVVTERRTEQRAEGYDVTYEYRGRRRHMRTAERPGAHVRLRVSVAPVGYDR